MIYKYLSYAIYLVLILSIKSNAQISISGNITDAELNPISNALVQVYEEEDKSNIYTTYTDNSGKFIIGDVYTDVNIGKLEIPKEHIILGNYPNPFNPTTIIYYEIASSDNIEIILYDIIGREVRTLFSNYQKEGIHRIVWDGKNNLGSAVSAGVYLCRLKMNDHFKVHKIVLLDGGSNTNTVSSFSKISSNHQEKTTSLVPFRFTIKVSEKYINPIEIRNIACNGDTSLTMIVTKPMVSTFGPEGGEFANDDFYLNIPPSSFDGSEELRLYTLPNFQSPLENTVTKNFRLEGIPSEYINRFRIGLKYEGELSNENVIEFGIKNFIRDLNDTVAVYVPIVATDSAGFLWADFPTDIIPTKTNSSKFEKANYNDDVNFGIYDEYLYLRGKSDRKGFETENFFGLLPEFAWHVPILNYFEIAYSKYQKMGFNFKPDDISTVGQANVFTGFFMNSVDEASEAVIFGDGDAYLQRGAIDPTIITRIININLFWWLFVDDYPFNDRLQAISGIVLFDALASVYDTRKIYGLYNINDYKNRPFLQNERYWFHKAVSFWAGELFTTEDYYVPPGFKTNEMAPFHGIVKGAGKDDLKIARLHGYGMTSLIKYLQDKANYEGRFNTFLHEVYLEIFAEKSPVDAIGLNRKEPLEIWLYDYFKEYLLGNIYDVTSSIFLSANDDDLVKIEIQDNSNFALGVTKEFADLSAKLFKFDFKYEETKEDNELQLKADYSESYPYPPSTLLFGLKDEKLEFIDGGIGTIKCNIKEAQTKGYNTLLAAIVNSKFNPLTYSDNSLINLDIKIKEKDSLNFSIVKLRTQGSFVYNDGETFERTFFYNSSGKARYGNFENGIFESQWLKTSYSPMLKGNIRLNVDLKATPPRIIDYYVHESQIGSDIKNYLIEGKNVNIAGRKRAYGGYEFYINGVDACNKINTISNDLDGPGDYGWSLTSHSCDNDSYVQIILGGD